MKKHQRQAPKSLEGITRPQARQLSRWQRVLRNIRRSRATQTLLLLGLLSLIIAGSILLSNIFKKPNYDDLTTVTRALSKHIILPTGEKPILATVTDRSALKTPFLKEAANGDRIIVYGKAKRVIIYRPSQDRIVDIGPVELNNIPKPTSP